MSFDGFIEQTNNEQKKKHIKPNSTTILRQNIT